MIKSALGTVVSALLRVACDYDDDPISEAIGIWPDPAPELARVAAQHGWTLQEVSDACEQRTTERWCYMQGIARITPTYSIPVQRRPR